MVVLLPLLLSAATIASAQNLVSGVGRLSLSAGASPSAAGSVKFSSNVLSSAVGSIVSSVSDGPNRTVDSALPTSKLYGVNVRPQLSPLVPVLTLAAHLSFSLVTGWSLSPGTLSSLIFRSNTDHRIDHRMNPTEWLAMGGEFCESGNCEDCRQSEWSLAMYLGQNQTNAVFKQRTPFIVSTQFLLLRRGM